MVPQRPFFQGRPGWVRSNAWIWHFSSSDKTIAFAGGCRYKPVTSSSFSAKRGSLLSLKLLTRCGFKPCARQIRPTVDALTPTAGATCACSSGWRPRASGASSSRRSRRFWRAGLGADAPNGAHHVLPLSCPVPRIGSATDTRSDASRPVALQFPRHYVPSHTAAASSTALPVAPPACGFVHSAGDHPPAPDLTGLCGLAAWDRTGLIKRTATGYLLAYAISDKLSREIFRKHVTGLLAHYTRFAEAC